MSDHQKYRITERIDAGGMAEVFRGVAESLQGFKKNVAIKRILPNLCKNKKFISMFLDEARLSLHLQHANIVAVFDIGVAPPEGGNPGAYFIVMEYVDGGNLKSVVESLRRQGKRLRVAHVLYVMMEVCKGLAYAHDITDPESGKPLNIVHRDISPPNILLSKTGEVKLVDFGLAKATSQLESTDPGVVKGKFSYLSPEAALGKEVDRRADVFAVGILLYELLTGKRLFYGETDYQTVELVRQARVPSITQQNPEVEADLEAVVKKALSRDVQQRYQHAGELLDALAQYLFSNKLKVTSRDIALLVQDCMRERRKSMPAVAPARSLIDQLIQDELLKFTSLEALADSPSPGGPPPAEAEPDGSTPLDAGLFIDTRSWADDATSDEGPAPEIPADAPTIVQMLPHGIAAFERDAAGAPPARGNTSGPARVATPLARDPPRLRDPSGIQTLESLLEGGDSAPFAKQPASATGADARGAAAAGAGSARNRWMIALVAFLLVGGTALYYLTRLIGNH